MADKLYFSRDAKLYVQLTSVAGAFQGVWEIPVLDGFSFSQATNQSEIGLNEMESTGGVSRRGRRLFTDSLAPAEWSFSTYIRPTLKNTTEHHLVDEVLWAAMAGADLHAGAGASENGDFTRNSGDKATASGIVLDALGGSLPSGGTGGLLSFGESNRSALPEIALYFVFETDTASPMVYKLDKAVVNECSVDFDIDGIATANWSGFAKEVTDLLSTDKVKLQSNFSSTAVGDVVLDPNNDLLLGVVDGSNAGHFAYNTGVTSTNNFIRNRITQLEVRGQNPDVMEGTALTITAITTDTLTTGTTAHGLKVGDRVDINGVAGATNAASYNTLLHVVAVPTTTTFKVSATAGGSAITVAGTYTASSGTVSTGIYNFTLTGGNVTISNNINYLVPEELGTINKPLDAVTGARGIGGNFTCYLTFDNAGGNTGASADFFSDLVDPLKGLTKVVNNFNVTFKVGGASTGPRLFMNFPKTHIDVPTHSIEDVISLETNFGAYTDDFDTVDEFNLEIYGV